MTPSELATWALTVLRRMDKLGPRERREVLYVAAAMAEVELARLSRPPDPKDE